MPRAETDRPDPDDGRPSPPVPKPVDDPRVYLAAERTFLAWVRTSISLMGFGFLIARFAFWIREYATIEGGAPRPSNHTTISPWLGFGMVVVGVYVCVTAATRHRGYVRAFERWCHEPAVEPLEFVERRGDPGDRRPGDGRPDPPLLKCGPRQTGKGISDATGHDRSGADGIEHGASSDVASARMRRLRRPCRGGGPPGQGRGDRRQQPRRIHRQAQAAASHLADGPGRGRGLDDRKALRPHREGRHPDRRRKLLLSRRHPTRRGPQIARDSLRGRGDQRRRLGQGPRLLHDDRRRAGHREAPGSRSSPRWPPGSATRPARRGAKRPAAPPSRATSTADPTARGISSRWSTTGSSTA